MFKLKKPRQQKKQQQNRTTLQKERLNTDILREEFEQGLQVLDKIRKERALITSQIESEISEQIILQDKINFLKDEYSKLKLNHNENKKTLSLVQKKTKVLKSDVARIEKTHSHIIKNSNLKTNVLGFVGNVLVENDFSELVAELNSLKHTNIKERSIMLTCIKQLIDTTQANEFSDFTWKAKVAYNSSSIGSKLRFEKLTIRPSDMKLIFKPIIESINEKFKSTNIQLKVESKKINGVVEILDFTFRIKFQSKEQHFDHTAQLHA